MITKICDKEKIYFSNLNMINHTSVCAKGIDFIFYYYGYINKCIMDTKGSMKS